MAWARIQSGRETIVTLKTVLLAVTAAAALLGAAIIAVPSTGGRDGTAPTVMIYRTR